jgi:DNA-binding Lrp family transcriptional regulator
LRKAITPDARKQDATSKILEPFEPAPLFGKSSSATGVKSRPVSVNTVSSLTPVSDSEGSAQPKRQGYLKIPNEILDSVLPALEPTEAVIFLRLYRLSVGFNQTCCTVGTGGLRRACNVSESTCRRALRRLIELGFIRQLEVVNTKEIKGTTYQIQTDVNLKPVSKRDRCQSETGVTLTPNKYDDLKHNNHHQSKTLDDDDSPHLQEVKAAYSQITGNPWLPSDTEAYRENRIDQVPASKVKATMEAVKQRCDSRINSFNYFVKEILASADPSNSQSQKRELTRIMRRVRELKIGGQNYSMVDFVDDVKCACAREGVTFDNDWFNSLNSETHK